MDNSVPPPGTYNLTESVFKTIGGKFGWDSKNKNPKNEFSTGPGKYESYDLF